MRTAISGSGRQLIVHLVYRLDTGGLENGVVNLINHMPAEAYSHAIVALTDVVPAFAKRIQRQDVELLSLHKPPGHGMRIYSKLWDVFRRLRPAIVHSRNLAALECQVPAALAGVPIRIHSEHGRDLNDLHNAGSRYRWIRKAYDPLVNHYVALSQDLLQFLANDVGVCSGRVTQIYNGVDTGRFVPSLPHREVIAGCPFVDPGLWVVGTVGRMQAIKDQVGLARAFVRALQLRPALGERLRLVMVGDGPLRAEARAVLDAAGVGALTWLPGERADVPNVMRGLDCFVLPSLSEGISNTILEAMASGLPVLATGVGGNAELVVAGETGTIVPANDVDAMAAGLVALAGNPARSAVMGRAGRARVERQFSLPAMVSAYHGLYDQMLAERTKT